MKRIIDPHRILVELGVLLGRKLRPRETLIIFDEVQFSPNTLTALKYFQEKTPEYQAHGESDLVGYLKQADVKNTIPEVFVSKLKAYLTTFYITGGMPEVVAS
ncbi:MAG TPA: hypothetical protein VJ967_09785 [Clostridia bacterium]|nr:hypothetical protein [Clostridia bacterium]